MRIVVSWPIKIISNELKCFCQHASQRDGLRCYMVGGVGTTGGPGHLLMLMDGGSIEQVTWQGHASDRGADEI